MLTSVRLSSNLKFPLTPSALKSLSSPWNTEISNNFAAVSSLLIMCLICSRFCSEVRMKSWKP